jgi:hypothetical protein
MIDTRPHLNSHPNGSSEPSADAEQGSLSFFQMVHSVGASFFGVQSDENRERDFKRGKASQFIAVAILMTIVWYGSIALLVHVVLGDN